MILFCQLPAALQMPLPLTFQVGSGWRTATPARQNPSEPADEYAGHGPDDVSQRIGGRIGRIDIAHAVHDPHFGHIIHIQERRNAGQFLEIELGAIADRILPARS